MAKDQYSQYGYAGDIIRRAEEERARKKARETAATSAANGQQLRDLSMQGLLDSQGRAAPQAAGTRVGPVATTNAAQIDTAQQGQFRRQQLLDAQRLGGIANGTVMGAGQMAVRSEGNRAIAQQQAMARMGRGAGAAIAARGAATNSANIGLNVAGQAGQAQRADAAQATATRAQLLGQGREQDIGLATGQAGLQQQARLQNMDAKNQAVFQQAGLNQATSLANMQARLAQTGMDDAASLQYLAQLYGVDMAEMQARLQLELGKNAQPKSPGWADVVAAVAPVATAYAASDRTLKKDIRKASSSIDKMLDGLEPAAYRYKDEKWGEGRRAGIMAQDLEKSEMGRRVVRSTPDGKMLDVNAALSASLAAAARLNQRVRELEVGDGSTRADLLGKGRKARKEQPDAASLGGLSRHDLLDAQRREG